MDDRLFNAILAMDSYNRGYDRAIKLDRNPDGGSEGLLLGNVTIYQESDRNLNSPSVAAGFYAIAYQDNTTQQVTISYRGTDQNIPYTGSAQTGTGSDMINGYGSSLGVPDTPQTRFAFAFYNEVAQKESGVTDGSWVDPRSTNIYLTGHSLGGGLAGLVGSVYNQDAALFDNMGFEAAAVFVPAESIVDQSFYDIVYGDAETFWFPTISSEESSKIQSYSIAGEFLYSNRVALPQLTPETFYNLGSGETLATDNVDLPISAPAEAFARHSMATLVIRMYAEYGGDGGAELPVAWQEAAPYFWQVLYDDEFAENLTEPDAAVLRTKIAYSAIDEGLDTARPFGDTGIRALYDDAHDLGLALQASIPDELFVPLRDHAKDISKVFINFTANLVSAKVLQSTALPTVLDGVLTYNNDENNKSLILDLTEGKWASSETEEVGRTAMIASDNLIGKAISASGSAESEVLTQMAVLWNNDTPSAFDYVVFAAYDENGGQVLLPTRSVASVAAVAAGEAIGGSAEVFPHANLFFGGLGDDRVVSSAGNDLLIGQDGAANEIDTLVYSDSVHQIQNITFNDHTIIVEHGPNAVDIVLDFEEIILTTLDDTVALSEEYSPDLKLNGDGGIDTLDFSSYTQGSITVSSEDIDGERNVGNYTFSNFEYVIGTDLNDTFKGGGNGIIFDGGDHEAGTLGDILDYSDYIDTSGMSGPNVGFVQIDLTDNTVVRADNVAGKTIESFLNIETFIGTQKNDYFVAKEGQEGIIFDGRNQTASGADVVDLRSYSSGIAISLNGTTFSDTLNGSLTLLDIEEIHATSFNDSLYGTSADERFFGYDSYDYIDGNGGNDYISGGTGYNELYGGLGQDIFVYSNNDADSALDDLNGGSGTDTIKLTGTLSFSLNDYSRDSGSNILTIADIGTIPSHDIEFVEYSDGIRFSLDDLGYEQPTHITDTDHSTEQTDGDDSLTGASGDNDAFRASLGNDSVSGGFGGYDEITYEFYAPDLFGNGIYVQGSTVTKPNPDGGGAFIDTLANIEGIKGTYGHDQFDGTQDDNVYYGGAGDDILNGADGDDILYANGIAGTLHQDFGIDILNGGNGNDWIFGNGGEGTDINGDGVLDGDTLHGDAGSDHLYGEGDDRVFGDEGSDFLFGTGNAVLDGGAGNDYLEGTGTFIESNGDDVIRAVGASSTLQITSSGLSALTFARAENNSLIIIKQNGERIIVLDHFGSSPLAYISDGSNTYDLSTHELNLTFINTEEDEVLIGGSGDEA